MQVDKITAYHIHRLGKYDECWAKGKEMSFGEYETNTDKLDEKKKEECEKAFENIRIKNYSTRPPHNKCLFVSNENNIQAWYNILTKGKDGSKLKPVKIFEVELTGNLFWADASIYEDYWNENDTKSIIDYWEGKVNQKDKVEGLFVGEVKILKSLNFDDFNILSSIIKRSIRIISPHEEPCNNAIIDFDDYQ